MYTTATDYIQSLCNLMNGTTVTNKLGDVLSLDQGAEEVVQYVLQAKRANAKVMLAGNGGSAAIVSHVQNDLFKRAGVRSLVFTEQPLLLALANDEGYEKVFEWPVQQWADPGDLVITVSSSGRSPNIIRCGDAALNKGCRLITFSGFDADNPLRKMGDLNFYVKSHSYGHVETSHAALTHFVTDRAMILEYPDSEIAV